MFTAMHEEGEAGQGGSASAVAGDATAMPFPDGSFDRVIAAEVLEHIPSDQAALNEVARVLRPGGLAAITVPGWLPERICWRLSDDYHNVPGGHVRIFTRGELERKLELAGLAVGGHHHAHALHSPYWWLNCAVGVHDDDHPLARAYHRRGRPAGLAACPAVGRLGSARLPGPPGPHPPPRPAALPLRPPPPS